MLFVKRTLRRLWPAKRAEYYYFGKRGRKHALEHRWADIASIADFRPTDTVLDMGCADGLISMQVARKVAHVHGVEPRPKRIERAKLEAAASHLANVTFEVGSAESYPLEPNSYDVILLLGILGKVPEPRSVLAKILHATRRQIILRVDLSAENAERGVDLASILAVMDECGFDGLCFPPSSRKHRTNELIIGNRRGAGAQLRMVPPNVVIPTAHMSEHPCLKGASISDYTSSSV